MRYNILKHIALIMVLALLSSLVAVAEDSTLDVQYVSNEAEVFPGDEAEALPEELDNADLTVIAENGTAQNAVPAELELGVKETYKLNTKGLGKKLTFKSSKAKIAKVDKKGVITGVKKGKAVITVLSGKKEVAKCSVTVLAAPSKISFSPKSITIGVGETVTVEPTIPYKTRAIFKWSTKSKKIATVSKAGAIKGKKVGKTTITATAQNKKKGTLTVNVAKAPGKVTLDKTAVTLDVNGTVQLKATLPNKTASYNLVWSSDNKQIATVDENGKVTAVAPGKTTITVKAFNGKKATCSVTVNLPPTPTPTTPAPTTPAPTTPTPTTPAPTTPAPTTPAPTTPEPTTPAPTTPTPTTPGPTTPAPETPTPSPAAEPTTEPASDALGFTIDKTEVEHGEKVTIVVTSWPKKYTADESANYQYSLYIYFDNTFVGGISKNFENDTAIIDTSSIDAGQYGIVMELCRYDYTTHQEETLHSYDGGSIKIKSNVVGDFTVSDGTISGYEGAGGDVALPSKDAEGNAIVAIGPGAFKGNTTLTRITIPATVTEIGESAFEGCSGLVEVIIPNGTEKIGKAAFKNCSKLESMQTYD